MPSSSLPGLAHERTPGGVLGGARSFADAAPVARADCPRPVPRWSASAQSPQQCVVRIRSADRVERLAGPSEVVAEQHRAGRDVDGEAGPGDRRSAAREPLGTRGRGRRRLSDGRTSASEHAGRRRCRLTGITTSGPPSSSLLRSGHLPSSSELIQGTAPPRPGSPPPPRASIASGRIMRRPVAARGSPPGWCRARSRRPAPARR